MAVGRQTKHKIPSYSKQINDSEYEQNSRYIGQRKYFIRNIVVYGNLELHLALSSSRIELQ